MYRMQWQCGGCKASTLTVEIPFGRHGELPATDLFCIYCQEMRQHKPLTSPARYTVGDALAAARAEEMIEESLPSVA